MRFVGTERFSPVIYGGDLPHELDLFNHHYELVPGKKKLFTEFCADMNVVRDLVWWQRQRKRCIEGYTVHDAIEEGGEIFVEGFNVVRLENGDRYIPHLDLMIHGNSIHITGKMYFYLNFWKIMRLDKELGRKKMGNPYFTDLSWENWWIRDLQWRLMMDHLWGKRRQGGFSEEEACEDAYHILFYDDVIQAIVAGQAKYAENTFGFVKRGYERLTNTEFYREISINNPEEFATKRTGSHLYCYTAKDNPQVLSRLTPFKVTFEEIGCWQPGMVLSTRGFVTPSQEATGIRTGLNTFIGTAGEDVEDTDDMEQMMFNPKQQRLLSFPNTYNEGAEGTLIAGFVPAWKFEIIDDEGNSLKKASIDKLNLERESMDAKTRFYAQTSKPFAPTDMFRSPSGGYFGPTIIQYCNETNAWLNTHRESLTLERGYLSLRDKKHPLAGVIFHQNEEGPILIREHPDWNDREGRAFEGVNNAATDSYDQDESLTSNSKGSCTIYKGFNRLASYDSTRLYNTFVAMVLERPSTQQGGRNVFYENSALLSLYYMAPNMVEWSKLLLFEWYEANGFESLLCPRPSMVIANMVEKSLASNKYGFPASLVPQALKKLRDYLSDEANVKACGFPDMLKAWAKFKIAPHYNCDVTISTALNIVSKEDFELQEEAQQRQNEMRKAKRMVYRRVGGRIVSSMQ